ncbi:MAG: hypothetical protein M3Q45_08400 [Chloroflexota bacterium]|nr:hypothetical protein [Chloroflexota bacterium]
MLTQPVLTTGLALPPPKAISLRAGPLTLLYDNGDLRTIKLGDQEIVRRIYVAVRDRNWGTLLPLLSNLQIETNDDSFSIRYTVENKQDAIDFTWQGLITGDAAGTITFAMEGVARTTFWRNRIGFCVLHPMRCAGQPVVLEQVEDGAASRVVHAAFPQTVSASQPVPALFDLQSIKHEVQPGVWAEVRFMGDLFETEDQRNWTDASFKTFCTPLRLPYPVEVKQGTRVAQSVTLTLKGAFQPSDAALLPVDQTHSQFTIHNSQFTIPLPQLGLGVASHGQPLTPQEIDRLRALHLAHLRVDLALAQTNYADRLQQATYEANALAIKLEIALHLTTAAEDELRTLLNVLAQIQPPVSRWLIYGVGEKSTPPSMVEGARRALLTYAPTARFGAGTNADFYHLNGIHEPSAHQDLVTFSINPQVHAFDNRSLMETLEAQAAPITTAHASYPDQALVVSPITLKPRFNPVATGPAPQPPPDQLPPQVDPRQMALFGAAWTVGSLKYVAEAGLVESVTYYETSGWRGVMEIEQGSPLPLQFLSIAGGVFPLYHVLADVGEFAGCEVIPTQSSDTLRIDGLALRKDGKLRVLLANLSAEAQSVTLAGLGNRVRVRMLDETNAEAAMHAPEAFRAQTGNLVSPADGLLEVDLLPYAVARLDSV